ncbi:hypothetical protein FNF31_07813 [Cafeteria roenbergensis]|uniref:Uncharacterized protein n=2 Tax=Cafeteria roenbergensis TaxID=33653 RepID=A0A5A8C115_CAFRO|nr:hypothetical protein FNF31_07813 [Cafeteria roenbergensis]
MVREAMQRAAASDKLRLGHDERMLPLGEPVAAIDAAVETKIVPMMRTLQISRHPDTLIVHAFADTADVVHGLVDGFARSGCVARVDAASPELVIRASVPLRGDSASVVVRVGLVGDPDLSHHCLVTEPETRMGSSGSRLDLRFMLQGMVAWLRDTHHFELESALSQGSIVQEPASVAKLPFLDQSMLFSLKTQDGTASTLPSDSGASGPDGATATLLDSTDAQLADFVHAGPAAGSVSTTSAVLGAFAESAAPASVFPALAERVVAAANKAGVASSSPAVSAASSAQTPPSRTTSSHTDTVPSDEDIRSARPASRGPSSPTARAEGATDVKEAAGEASSPRGARPGCQLFAASSDHIRACLQAQASQREGTLPAAAEMAESLTPLARAMGSTYAPSRRQAVTSTGRLVLGQMSTEARARVTEALALAGVAEQLGALLSEVARHYLEAEAARGGAAATREPRVALDVAEAAAGAAGFTVEDLIAALRTALAVGGGMERLFPVADGPEASQGGPDSSPEARRSALQEAVLKWVALPDGAGASVAHLQRAATEFMDLVTDCEELDAFDV